MRTTLSLEPDVLIAAKQLAAAQSKSLGTVISELARKGLRGPEPTRASTTRNGFPLFEVKEDSPSFSLDDIKREDEEW